MHPSSRSRPTSPGLILALVSGAQFMVILDLAIVNVALPSIQADLGASQSELQWVVVAYGLTLGGFLLLGGRLADLFGRRRVLVSGLGLFAVASLASALSSSLGPLVAGRALQGMGGALASPAALSIVSNTFAEGEARNKALGIFGAVGGTAASVGLIAGGSLTSGPGWQWVFLINVPVGLALVALVLSFVPASPPMRRGRLDVGGAVAVTAGLMAVVYAINKSSDHGWGSGTVVGFLAAGLGLLAVFVVVEAWTPAPLVPLGMFRRRNLSAANLVALLLWGAFAATIFQGTLFMQQVLGYSAVETGAAWLPATLSSLVVAGGIAPRVVGWIRPAATLVVGLVILAVSLVHLSQASADAAFWTELFPGFLGFGIGVGLSAVAIQVGAFTGIEESVSGLAGGMVETARELGSAIGVAVVATIALSRTEDVLASLGSRPVALTEGFERACLIAAAISLVAALAAGLVMRRAERGVRLAVEVGELSAPEPVLQDL